jgi:AAA+ ATPase superfamily predicted ATPase
MDPESQSHPILIDRERERSELYQLLASGEPRLALLTGRRRIGKTYLLTHAWDPEPMFLFTAARTTPEFNRRQLVTDLARWTGEDLRPEDYPTWRAVFNLLLDLRAPEPLVVVLDEFQYLADNEAGVAAVASELNAAWERRRPPRPFLLVLSGSAVGTMEALASGGGPLYGRFVWQHRLQPFDYWYAGEMAPFADLRERALAYGVFGGTPRYLSAVDSTLSFAENATRLLLSQSGEVRLLVETALDQEEGLRDVSKYRAILRAVASGCTERNEIAQRAGLPNDAALRDKLSRLIELGYLETRQNVDARPNEAVRYGIADPAFRFHQRFVEPNTSVLARYPAEQVWESQVAPHLDAYMGLEFERIATQAYNRRRAALGLPMVQEWGRWEGVDRARRPLEIDLVASLVGGSALTGAVKWDRDPIGAKVHWDHLDMLRRAADAGRRWAYRALEPDSLLLYVAADGFAPGFQAAAEARGHRVVCWRLEDLYAV